MPKHFFPVRAACFALLLACGAALAGRAAVEDLHVDFDYVRRLAANEASRPYHAPDNDLPARLGSLSYDEYRSIRFAPAEAMWRKDGLPFQLEFFHRGGLFRERVTLHEFSDTHEQIIPFLREFFTYQNLNNLPPMHSTLGYAGFRVHTQLNRPGVFDEVIAFLGSSYFRAIGADQVYGLSARGLALNSGIPGVREEFPRFTEFWIGKPEKADTSLTIYALLSGPNVSGAYEFVVRPGKATFVDVHAEVTFRSDSLLAGLAPLTSMFWFGENSARPPGEVRPEVHDSDGLMVDDGAVRPLWRPLQNPRDVATTVVPVQKLVRFGLLQRDRRLTSYEDLETRYEKRPSAWIEPRGEWDAGSVHLVELPDPAEHGDNIVAYWVPAAKPQPGHPLEFRYRIVWSLADPPNGNLARVVNTREGALPNDGHLFWIDFSDEKNAARDLATMEPVIVLRGEAKIRHFSVTAYPEIHGCRVAIETDAAKPGQSISLRCYLRNKTEPVSETWSYLSQP
ncbi:MAG: glucan biosynthesis protein [Verrucomicrobia bacterium]|nr:glucan biosynthesis protein [Verrucomicrobiota bacterium]